jgi:hypothetical protein
MNNLSSDYGEQQILWRRTNTMEENKYYEGEQIIRNLRDAIA